MKDEWAAKERAVLRRSWLRSMDRGQVHCKGWSAGGIGKKGALAAPSWLLLPVVLSHFYALLIILNLLSKNDLL